MKEIKRGFIILILFSFLTGIVYPILITIPSQILWRDKANGSLIKVKNEVIGSKLIGQRFSSPKYFHGRPSVINYDGNLSSASNLGPTSKKLIQITKQEIEKVKAENSLSNDTKIPGDLVLSSASGLDPHISLESAYLQAERVSKIRNIPLDTVKNLIVKNTENSQFNFLGEVRVNVLLLNLDLDKI